MGMEYSPNKIRWMQLYRMLIRNSSLWRFKHNINIKWEFLSFGKAQLEAHQHQAAINQETQGGAVMEGS